MIVAICIIVAIAIAIFCLGMVVGYWDSARLMRKAMAPPHVLAGQPWPDSKPRGPDPMESGT